MAHDKTQSSIYEDSTLKSAVNEDLFFIVGWLLVFIIPLGHRYYETSMGLYDSMPWRSLLDDWFGILPFLLLFVLSKWVYEPKFFFRQKIRTYLFLSVFSAFIVMYSYSVYAVHNLPVVLKIEQAEKECDLKDENLFQGLDRGFFSYILQGPFVSMFTMSILVMGSSLCINFVFRTRKNQLIQRATEAARDKTELDYLKYQINPHFFMNTLNNIHALVDIDSQLAKNAIIELSRLMRYMLYETSSPTVPLYKELNFQRHFIELMRLRYDDSVAISIVEPPAGSSCLNSMIPPLIGIVFVENAFKHGVSHREKSFINVSFTQEAGDLLHFHCSNSVFHTEPAQKQASGLGLVNVRKRLDLLYPKSYQLDIHDSEKEFVVDLLVPMNNNALWNV